MSASTRALGPCRLARAIRLAAAAAATITLCLAALAASPGTSTASAATRPAATASGVTWHKLTLLNGWLSSEGTYHTGDPAWAIKNGIVYLSGSMHEPAFNSVFAVLPPAARPAHAVYIELYTVNDTYGHIEIFPTGEASVASIPLSNAQAYTSLAEISFPAAHAPAHRLTLLHGWKPSLAMDGKPSYSVSKGVVYLSGAMQQAAGSNDVAAVLPRAARPARVMYIPVNGYAYSASALRVEPNGRLHVFGGLARSFTSLGGVSWSVAKFRTHKLRLINGWKSGQKHYGTSDPAYSVANGVVYLSGALLQPRAGSGKIAVLPLAARPAHYLYIKVYSLNDSLSAIKLAPNGTVLVFSLIPGDARGLTSLAGISYPVNS